jgi:ankyrin repeat protein
MSQHLIAAAERGELSKVREILERGAEIHYFSKSRGMTALHVAIVGRHLEIARWLAERGADASLTEPGLIAD